jgi:hypothetical protein
MQALLGPWELGATEGLGFKWISVAAGRKETSRESCEPLKMEEMADVMGTMILDVF